VAGWSTSLFHHIDRWRNNVHDTVHELRRKWQDEASDALDSFINNKVDDCFDALESRCEAVATAIRAMADAQDALNQSIEDATNLSLIGALVTGGLGTAAVVLTGGGSSAVAIAVASPIVGAFVTWAFQALEIYKAFVRECEGSLDKLGVSGKVLGGRAGNWPRPWARGSGRSQ
jgi:hypothetical protein